jgi:hypothetical protein
LPNLKSCIQYYTTCSLPRRRIQEIKRMYSASLAHGLFYNLNTNQHQLQTICPEYIYIHKYIYSAISQVTLPLTFIFDFASFPFTRVNHSPLHELTTPFYLLGDPFFSDLGANIHPLSSLASNQLLTPLLLNPP